jgi:hypothetical protein
MASEVRTSEYLFKSNLPQFNELGDMVDIFLPPFRHNCLHDLESAWWIGLWTTYVFAPDAPSAEDVTRFKLVFPPSYIQTQRTDAGATLLISSSWGRELRPAQNGLVFASLDGLRKKLFAAYSKLETNRAHEGMLDESAFEHAHDEVLTVLNALLEALERDPLGKSQLVRMCFSGNSNKKRRID